MTTTRRIVLARRPDGPPTAEDFRLEAAPLAAPGEGEATVRVIWLSLDPYMRGRMSDAPSYAPPTPIGATMEGGAIGEVIASRDPSVAPGEIVAGPFGWAEHATVPASALRRVDVAGAPLAAALGVLGMPGLTAWVGLTEIAQARAGETILVSAATGAVGAVACQLARLRGLRVIGVAGGAKKCAWAVKALGCDACLDHRAAADAAALSAAIAGAAPEGIDVYFENVGGTTLAATLPLMKVGGRIAVCGMVAWYSGRGVDEAIPAPLLWRTILTRRLTARGFIVLDHEASRPAFLAEVAPLARDGRLVWRETVAEGLEAAPAAFMAMLEGGNFGKTLVRLGPDPA